MSARFTNTEGAGWAFTEATGTGSAGITVTAPTDLADGWLALVLFGQDGDNSGAEITVSGETPTTSLKATAGPVGNDGVTGMVGYWE